MKKRNFVSALFIIGVFFFMMPLTAQAKDHSFSLDAYYCDKTTYNDTDDTKNYENCLKAYVNNTDSFRTTYKRDAGSKVDPGSLMLFTINYHLGDTVEVNSYNLSYHYDSSVWTPGLRGTSLYSNSNIFNPTSVLPTDNDPLWVYSSNVVSSSHQLRFMLTDNNNNGDLFDKDFVAGYFFMKLNDNASGTVSITGPEKPTEAELSNPDGDSLYGNGSFVYSDATGISFTTDGTSPLSTDNTLGTLTAKNNNVDYFYPAFVSGSETLNYHIYVPYSVSKIDLDATAHDSKATILTDGSQLGEHNLDVGANVFIVTVSSESGKTKTYNITIQRLSNDTTLSKLKYKYNNTELSFKDSENKTWTTDKLTAFGSVPFAIDNVSIEATPTHEKAKITTGTGNFDLGNYGDTPNTRTLTVNAEDCNYSSSQMVGSKCTSQNYTINISRENPSTNAYLSSIILDGNDITSYGSSTPPTSFDKTVTEYDMGTVENNVNQVLINAIPEDSKSTVTGISSTIKKTLKVGDNTFNIDVTAEDKTTKKTYTIKIHRKSNDTKLSSINAVSDVPSLDSFGIDTTSGNYLLQYNEFAKKFTVTATVNDTDKAYVSISKNGETGTKVLNTDSKEFDISTKQVLVTVTAEDGSTQTYVIDTRKSLSTDATLKSLNVCSDSSCNTKYTLSPTFSSEEHRYTVSIEPEVTSVVIDAATTSGYASIDSITASNDLQFGDNEITINVKPESGAIVPYYVTVKRKYFTDSSLKTLSVSYGKDSTAKTIDVDLTKCTTDTDGTINCTVSEDLPYEVNEITINATKNEEHETIDGTGSFSIDSGNNTYPIVVTAHDGTTKTNYKLNIGKKYNSDFSIKNLKVKGLTPTYDSEITTDETKYTLTVENDTTSIVPSDITFDKASDATSSVTQTLDLKTKQDNIYSFTVTSANGVEHKYSVYITRKSSSKANIDLLTLTPKDSTGDLTARTCVMDKDNSCDIEVPVSTTGFSVTTKISDAASIDVEDGTEYDMPASDSKKVITLVVTAEDGTIATYTVNVTRAKSSIKSLSSIIITDKHGNAIDGLSMTPNTFNTNTNIYNISVPGEVSNITVNATASDTDKAKVDLVNATDNFDEDTLVGTLNTESESFDLTFNKTNVIRAYVIAEDKTYSYYTLNVTREKKKNANLTDLTVGGQTVPGFTPTNSTKSTTYDYYLDDLGYNDNQIVVVATLSDVPSETPYDESMYATKGGDGVIDLKTGDNSVIVTVTAQDTSVVNKYVIHVKRALNDDTGIKSIQIKVADDDIRDAKYNSSTKKYEVTVPNNVQKIDTSNLIVNVNDPKTNYDKPASVSFNPQNLYTTDANDVGIQVTAENGTSKKSYILSVTREKSKVATLSSIDIVDDNGTKIGTFNPTKPFIKDTFTPDEASGDTMTYEVTIPVDAESFKINCVKTDSYSTVSGDGRYTIDTSSSSSSVTEKILTVTSEDATVVNHYKLKISREKSSNDLLSNIKIVDDKGNDYADKINFVKNAANNSYTITVDGDVEKVKISAERDDNRSSLSFNDTDLGNNNLTDREVSLTPNSDNVYKIIVTAENGTAQLPYTITIKRKAKPYNELGTLIINDDTIIDSSNNINKFDSENKYTLDSVISYDIGSISYTITPKDSDATYTATVKNEAGTVSNITGQTIPISTGENLITINIQAQDGTINSYYVTVKKNKNAIAKLDNITVKNANGTTAQIINIQDGVYDYNVTVGENKTSLPKSDVTYTLSNDSLGAKVTQDDDITDLVTSDQNSYPNTYKIYVTSEDGTSVVNKEYVLHIRRPKSTNALIDRINLNNASLESGTTFNENTDTYTLIININSDNFKINAHPKLSTTTVNGDYTYTYHLDDSGNIYLTYTDSDNNEQRIDGNVVTISGVSQSGIKKDYKFTIRSAKSEDTSLTSLSVADQPFKTAFSVNSVTDTYELKNNVEYSQSAFNITANPTNPKATVTCFLDNIEYKCNNVTLPLESGEKSIIVRVTSASKTKTRDYTIKYKKVLSNDAYLSSLVMDKPSKDIGFSSTKQSYNINVENSVENAKFSFKLDDLNASLKVNNNALRPDENGVYTYSFDTLVEGENTLQIDTLAQDGITSYSYTVKVVRAKPAASPEARLSNLTVADNNEKNYPFTFDSGDESSLAEFDIGTVDFDATSLKITATPLTTVSSITYSLDGMNSQDSNVVSIPRENGEHFINIQVVAKDNKSTKTYRIKYKKNASTNSNINVVLDKGSFVFDKDTLTYTVNVGRTVNIITATIKVADSTTSINVNGTDYPAPNTSAITYPLTPLSAGSNIIQITVTPQAGEDYQKIYKIDVVRESDPDKMITSNLYGHEIDDTKKLVKTIKINDTVDDLINKEYTVNRVGNATSGSIRQLDNPSSYLSVWNADNTVKLDSTSKLATGMIVKLTIDGNVEDSDSLVIKGDTDGNGRINNLDAVTVVYHIFKKNTLNGAYLEAADVDSNGRINNLDAVAIVYHIFGKKKIFE